MAKIDTLVRQHYESKRLDDAALERLAQMASPAPACEPATGRASTPWARPDVRAGVGLAIAATLIFALLFTLVPYHENHGLQQRVAQEIALNHNKNLGVEYASSDLQQLAARMTELDFQLRPPEQFATGDLTLIGARYCSIQGQIAAQLKYRSGTDGTLYTLYQTRLNNRLDALQPGSLAYQDVTIELWQADNLLMGLATNAIGKN